MKGKLKPKGTKPLVPELPFGGVGNSGMGKYHGEWGFRAYTTPTTFFTTEQSPTLASDTRHTLPSQRHERP